MNKRKMRGFKEGLKVVISAGASGIGRIIAETFADRGASVHICDIDGTALENLSKERPDIGFSKADVAAENEVNAWFDAAEMALGGLDVLVNNAGIAGPTAPIDKINPDDWRKTIDINLNGHFYCLQRAVPLLKKSDVASIINLSSVAGRLGFPLRTPYAATKWGIVGLTQSLARELGPFGIRVNSIQPGAVEGPRFENVLRARAQATDESYTTVRTEALEKISLRKTVSEQDIAEMAAFLCTPMGANITGQALSICAGVEDI